MLLTSSKRGSTNVFACKGVLILLFLLIGATGGRPAYAQDYTYFPNNATINYAILQSDTIVGYANYNDLQNGQNPTSPTVAVVAGGSIVWMDVYNSSHVSISGGTINGGVAAGNSSQVSISGGSITADVVAEDGSHVSISGGTIGGVEANNSSTISINGGTFDIVEARNSSTVNFYGKNLLLYDPTPGTVNGVNYVLYTLSGTLSDGTNVTGLPVVVDNTAKTNLKVAQLPQVELDIYDTNPSDAIVISGLTIPAKAKLVSPGPSDVTISLTPSSTGTGAVTLSTSTLILPRNGTPAPFQITGTAGSSAIGDVAIEATYTDPVGETHNVGSGNVTVAYFTNPKMTITESTAQYDGYIFPVDKKGVLTLATPQGVCAVTFAAGATLNPAGTPLNGPLKNLYFGIVQNVTSVSWEAKVDSPWLAGGGVQNGDEATVPVSYSKMFSSNQVFCDNPFQNGPVNPAFKKPPFTMQPCNSSSSSTGGDSPGFPPLAIQTWTLPDIHGNNVPVHYLPDILSEAESFTDWCVLYDPTLKPGADQIILPLCSSSWTISADAWRPPDGNNLPIVVITTTNSNTPWTTGQPLPVCDNYIQSIKMPWVASTSDITITAH